GGGLCPRGRVQPQVRQQDHAAAAAPPVHRGAAHSGGRRLRRVDRADSQGEGVMVVLNKIYTRTGDAGETALASGARVPKHAPRVAAYGTVDELNATIGLARLGAEGEADAGLARIQ